MTIATHGARYPSRVPGAVAPDGRASKEGTMPTSKAAEARRAVPRFTYAPGDGRRYVWMEGADVIKVQRIMDGPGGRLLFRRTGDTIPVPTEATTTALADAVDAWRAGRPAGPPSPPPPRPPYVPPPRPAPAPAPAPRPQPAPSR